MLKSLSQQQTSPAHSPRYHYAPASSPLQSSRSRSNSKGLVPKPAPAPPLRAQYVDASTQWSPMMSTNMASPPHVQTGSAAVTIEASQEADSSATTAVPGPHVGSPVHEASQTKPLLQPSTPGMKRRQSRDAPIPVPRTIQPIEPKRAKSNQSPVKFLPAKYEFCPVVDMVVLIANMINELIQANDGLPLRSGEGLTRFHSRTPPGISVLDYLQRLAKHATLTPPLLLSMVYYIDRLCLLYPAFTITTLTVHRFLITAATVAAKGLSDSFWNNSTYARVGGIKTAELGLLELDFLYRVEWKIVPNPEALIDYYRGLVERSDGYEIESDTSSLDEVDQDNIDLSNEVVEADIKKEPTTDVKWKAWMEDVSSHKVKAGPS